MIDGRSRMRRKFHEDEDERYFGGRTPLGCNRRRSAIAGPAGWTFPTGASVYGAASANKAEKTATTSGAVPLTEYGTALDDDGSTMVYIEWDRGDLDEDPPTEEALAFQWTVTGDVSDVQEVNGTAIARVGYTVTSPGYLSTYPPTYERMKHRGTDLNDSVDTSIRTENFTNPWPVLFNYGAGKHYLLPNLDCTVYTWASAEFVTQSGAGSAHAKSAAATISVITDSIDFQ
ncbi:MAG: hypothetical protein JWN98_2344 [Abditibacteriota bacterium]|nr:hypothetical protein [Abditibacteriota bacterium]